MKIRIFVSVILVFVLSVSLSFGAEGLVTLKSPYSVKTTLDRLEALVEQKGMTVFERIDHAEGAKQVGKSLRPTEVVLFGNPQGGTPFMECAQTVGIDLPLKALAWEDASGQVWLGYNDPAYLAQRHDTSEAECPVVGNLVEGLGNIAKSVTAPE